MPAPPRLQDLPDQWARFCLGIERFAADELGRGFAARPCLAACSGGADSTALLLMSALLCRHHGGSLRAAHLDHGLREGSADDADFVRALCENWDIPLVAEQADVAGLARQRGCGLEEAGRQARYAFLQRVGKDNGTQVLLLGHQLNDLAEDQLLRLLRGSGWPSLGGMPGRDDARGLLRPLLLTPREHLEAFLKDLGQPWRVDPTNAEPCATRNRVRLEVLPGLLRENPAYLDAAARLWRQARLDEAHWDAELARALTGLAPWSETAPPLLPDETLRQAPAPLRLRLYKHALQCLGPGQALSDVLFRLDALWSERARGRVLRFPGDKEARIDKAGVAFRVIDRKKECG